MDPTASVPQTAREAAAPVSVVNVQETSASVGTSASAPRTAARAVQSPPEKPHTLCPVLYYICIVHLCKNTCVV